MNRRLSIASLAAATALATLTACAAPAPDPADDTTLSIVASTNVYGDIATTIAGDHAEVTNLIASAAQDPHSYEASAQDQLAIADADLIIENGGGYDPFIDTLLKASGNDSAIVLNVVEISGLAPDEDEEHAHDEHEEHADDEGHEGHDHIEGFNEHVWYNFEAVDAFAKELAEHLGDLDPANADTFTANYETFSAGIAALEETAHALHETLEGKGVAITEPVPLYLLAELGLDNRTPEEFSEAIEEDADVPPAALADTLALFRQGSVALLAYNSQTASRETEQVREAAEAAGVPVVDFAETLPDGADYLSWMTANVEAVANALR